MVDYEASSSDLSPFVKTSLTIYEENYSINEALKLH